jgi:hypothetical protein
MIIPDCSCGRRCMAGMDKCATCLTADRRSGRVKEATDNSPINKKSVKTAKVEQKYNNRLKTWKRGKKCTATFPHECSTVIECHHMAGRSNDEFWDEWAMENEVVKTLDERLWRPLCPEAHRYVTINSKWACENGYSFKRVSDKIFWKKETTATQS